MEGNVRISGDLKAIDPCEALRYLGWRGTPVESALMQQLESCIARVREELSPGVLMRIFPLERGCAAQGTSFCAQGEDVRRMLKPCHRIVLLAATLGAQSERMLLREQAVAPERAPILDAVMSAAVEALCEQAQEELRALCAAKQLYLTDRFSPGYGDMPLEQTKAICEVLETGKKIGLTVAQSGIMIPRKSVSAVIGISRAPCTHRARGCAVCTLKDGCPHRRKTQGGNA